MILKNDTVKEILTGLYEMLVDKDTDISGTYITFRPALYIYMHLM